jgi:peptidyl-prolyl cis-trans isomerase C
MTRFSRTLPAIVLALAALPLAAHAQNITVVNGKPVPKARFDAFMAQVASQGQERTPELEKQIRDELVMREIFSQEAERLGLQNGDEIKAQLEVARQGLLGRELARNFEKKNPVTQAEIQAEYDRAKCPGGKEYHARHIMVEKEDEAKALIVELKAGAKFETLAQKSSMDRGSASMGGDLDWACPSLFDADFAKTVVSLEKGKFTEVPVKSKFGYHVVMVEDERAAQLPPLESVKEQLQDRLKQEKMAKFRDDLRSKAKTDYKFGE